MKKLQLLLHVIRELSWPNTQFFNYLRRNYLLWSRKHHASTAKLPRTQTLSATKNALREKSEKPLIRWKISLRVTSIPTKFSRYFLSRTQRRRIRHVQISYLISWHSCQMSMYWITVEYEFVYLIQRSKRIIHRWYEVDKFRREFVHSYAHEREHTNTQWNSFRSPSHCCVSPQPSTQSPNSRVKETNREAWL